MRSIYEKPGYVNTYVVDEKKTIVVKWDKLSDNAIIKESCLAQLEEVKKGARYLIIDTADSQGVPSRDTQEWFGTTLFPSFDKAGMKSIITVVPKSALSRMASKTWINKGSTFGFSMYDAVSQEEGNKLIEKLKSEEV